MEIPLKHIIDRIHLLKFRIILIVISFIFYGGYVNFELMSNKIEYRYSLDAKSQSEITFNKNTGFQLLSMQIMERSGNDNLFSIKKYYETLVDKLNYQECYRLEEAFLCFEFVQNKSSEYESHYLIKAKLFEELSSKNFIHFINKKTKDFSIEILRDFYNQFETINSFLYYNGLLKPTKVQIENSEKFDPFVYNLNQFQMEIIDYSRMFYEKLIIHAVIGLMISILYVIGPLALKSFFKEF